MPFPVLYVLHISTFVFVYRCGTVTQASSVLMQRFTHLMDRSNHQHTTHNSAPFLYQTDPVGTFLCVQFLVIVYYGLLSISVMIENPFRYASGGFSLPLEKFCKQIHNVSQSLHTISRPTSPLTHHSLPTPLAHATPQQDTLEIARLLGGDEKTLIPAHLEPPPVDALVGNNSSSQAVGLDPRKLH